MVQAGLLAGSVRANGEGQGAAQSAVEVRRIEVILAGDPDQGEQRVASGISGAGRRFR